MKTTNIYYVSYLKNGDLFETTTEANTADEAREEIAIRFNIPRKFEIGTVYMNENNHVSAVIQIRKRKG